MTIIVDKQTPTKTVDGVAFPASAFAYVPDPQKSSTWKLRLVDTPADAAANKPSVRITAAAVLALSPSGFRGQRVQIPAADLAAVKAKVAAAWLKARRDAGQKVTRENLPGVVKVQQIQTAQKALSLSLDAPGESAFSRLTVSLPTLAKRLSETYEALEALARDMVTTSKTDAVVGASVEAVVADLGVVAGQIKNEAARERFVSAGSALEGFAVPQNRIVVGEGASVIGTTTTDTNKVSYLSDEDALEVPEVQFRILKKESEEERTVLGVVLEPEEIDTQKDIYNDDEIRKTAWRFMERYQQFGLMHKQIVPSVLPLESYLAPVDFEVGTEKIKKGTWLLRVRVQDDAIWKKVKKGELTGFSIGGSAMRTPEKAPEKTPEKVA